MGKAASCSDAGIEVAATSVHCAVAWLADQRSVYRWTKCVSSSAEKTSEPATAMQPFGVASEFKSLTSSGNWAVTLSLAGRKLVIDTHKYQ